MYAFRLFDFPDASKDLATRSRWLEIIQRIDPDKLDWAQPLLKEKVCSKHFILGEPTDDSPDPEIFPELVDNKDLKQRLSLVDAVKRAIAYVLYSNDASELSATNKMQSRKRAQIALVVVVANRRNSHDLWIEQNGMTMHCTDLKDIVSPFVQEIDLDQFITSVIKKPPEELYIPLHPLIREHVITELGSLQRGQEELEGATTESTATPFDALMADGSIDYIEEDHDENISPHTLRPVKRKRISMKRKLTSLLKAESEFPDEDLEHLPLEVVATKMVALSNKQALALVHSNPGENKPTVYTFGNVITTLLDTIYALKNLNLKLRKEVHSLENSVQSREITVNLLQ